MGNCQAVDAAALVIQHPNGKVERMYWAVKANEVMKLNPGYYVSLIIPLPASDNEAAVAGEKKKTVRYTRVKLLRPTDTLVLGHAYRLLTNQEVKKVMRAKKLANAKMSEMESADKLQPSQEKKTEERNVDEVKAETEKNAEGSKQERKLRSGSMNSRSKTWQPSLQSISETVN